MKHDEYSEIVKDARRAAEEVTQAAAVEAQINVEADEAAVEDSQTAFEEDEAAIEDDGVAAIKSESTAMEDETSIGDGPSSKMAVKRADRSRQKPNPKRVRSCSCDSVVSKYAIVSAVGKERKSSNDVDVLPRLPSPLFQKSSRPS